MKRHSSRGFTLVEILVATLILVLVSLCVMVGTNSAQKIYRESLFVSESETLADTLNTAVGDVLHYAEFNEVRDGKLLFTSKNYSVVKGYFVIQENLLFMTPNDTPAEGDADLLQILGKSAYSGLCIKDFTITYADGVFSGGYTIYHPSAPQLHKEIVFTNRTIR